MDVKFENVSRVTVASDDGIEFEKYGLYKHGVDVVIQDEGRTLKIIPRLTPPGWQGSVESYQRLSRLVGSGASLSEIRKTMGTDPRTVRKWFPDYRVFPVGGGGEAEIIRQVNQDLKRIDSTGRIKRRHRK